MHVSRICVSHRDECISWGGVVCVQVGVVVVVSGGMHNGPLLAVPFPCSMVGPEQGITS